MIDGKIGHPLGREDMGNILYSASNCDRLHLVLERNTSGDNKMMYLIEQGKRTQEATHVIKGEGSDYK